MSWASKPILCVELQTQDVTDSINRISAFSKLNISIIIVYDFQVFSINLKFSHLLKLLKILKNVPLLHSATNKIKLNLIFSSFLNDIYISKQRVTLIFEIIDVSGILKCLTHFVVNITDYIFCGILLPICTRIVSRTIIFFYCPSSFSQKSKNGKTLTDVYRISPQKLNRLPTFR